jgi:hypothetical protein
VVDVALFFLRTLDFSPFSDKLLYTSDKAFAPCCNSLELLIMRVPEHPTLIRRMLDSRLAKLGTSKPVLAASLVQITKHCGRSCCHCQQGGPLHTAWHLTFKVKGRSRSVYVPVDLLDEVRSWVEEHKRIKTVLAEIHELSVALVRTHAQHNQRKKGRP